MKPPLRCRLLGHKYPRRSQVWADVERREKDGTWLQVSFGCVRCSAGALLGSLWLQDGGTTAVPRRHYSPNKATKRGRRLRSFRARG